MAIDTTFSYRPTAASKGINTQLDPAANQNCALRLKGTAGIKNGNCIQAREEKGGILGFIGDGASNDGKTGSWIFIIDPDIMPLYVESGGCLIKNIGFRHLQPSISPSTDLADITGQFKFRLTT